MNGLRWYAVHATQELAEEVGLDFDTCAMRDRLRKIMWPLTNSGSLERPESWWVRQTLLDPKRFRELLNKTDEAGMTTSIETAGGLTISLSGGESMVADREAARKAKQRSGSKPDGDGDSVRNCPDLSGSVRPCPELSPYGTVRDGTRESISLPDETDSEREIIEVFQHYKASHPKARRTPKSDAATRAAIEGGATVEDCKLALDGVMLSDWHIERGCVNICDALKDQEMIARMCALAGGSKNARAQKEPVVTTRIAGQSVPIRPVAGSVGMYEVLIQGAWIPEEQARRAAR